MSEADGAIDSVKEAFQGKRGKILLIGGGAAIAVYVWWTRRNGTPEDVPGSEPVVADGPSGRTPQTDPEVGNTNTSSGTSGPRKYTNNADWLADGTSFLQGRGTPAGSAYDALTKALGGQSLSQQEIAWVSQVIGALGAPPEGMPPLNAQTPTGNPQTTLAAPSALRVTRVDKTGLGVDWADAAGAKGYQVSVNGKLVGNPYTSGYPVSGLKPNTRYTVSVKSVGTGGKTSAAVSTTATTKK